MSRHHKSTRNMNKLRAEFFNQGKDEDAHCWLCNQLIDYDSAPGTTDDSHELDHYHPASTHPELQEDPTNFRHSHRRCNRQRGNQDPTTIADLGETVPAWW